MISDKKDGIETKCIHRNQGIIVEIKKGKNTRIKKREAPAPREAYHHCNNTYNFKPRFQSDLSIVRAIEILVRVEKMPWSV